MRSSESSRGRTDVMPRAGTYKKDTLNDNELENRNKGGRQIRLMTNVRKS